METPSQPILAISYFFHLVATVVWVGGLLMLGLLVWPEARKALSDSPALATLLARLRKRFTPLTNLSLAVLIVTGLVQMTADPNYDGLLKFSNEWTRVILLKHIAIGGMFVSGLLLQYSVVPALERASLLAERGKGDPEASARLRRREVRLTWLNIGLGILVLAFSAWATSI
jgi:uncharacterized membrane protein